VELPYREMPFSRAFCYKSPRVPNKKRSPVKQNLNFFSKSPVKEPLSMVSRARTERDTPFIYLFIYSHLSVSKFKEVSLERGKYMVTVHGVPRGLKVYIQWCMFWFPKGNL
jgi:hypothetical protein